VSLVPPLGDQLVGEADALGHLGEPPPEPAEDLGPGLEDQSPAIRTDRQLTAFLEAELPTQLDGDDEATLRSEPNRKRRRTHGASLAYPSENGNLYPMCHLRSVCHWIRAACSSITSGCEQAGEISVKPTSKGTITNTAQASAASPPDPNPVNNKDEEATTVVP
jgi:hypothetical protein